nr:hypothetical protein BaRGS_034368 [Batillaria attramentaria]
MVGMPTENMPDAGSSAGEQMTFEFEGGRAEDTLREVSWLSDDQIEDMDDEDEEGVKDEVCATVKLNTSINRLTKFTILNPEDLPSVVMDYPRKLLHSSLFD